MHKDFLGWSLENINAGTVETNYTVECIRDEKTWKKFCETEDIDLYEKRKYNNISKALTFYLIWFISDQCYDIKLWEQIFVNGEMVLEQPIEPQRHIVNSMRMQIDRDMKERLHNTEQKVVEAEKENSLLKGFIEYTKQQDLFFQFIKWKNEGK